MKISGMNIHLCLLSFCPSSYILFPLAFLSSFFKKVCTFITLYFLPFPHYVENWEATYQNFGFAQMAIQLEGNKKNNPQIDSYMVLQSRQSGIINNQHAQWVNKCVLFDKYVMSGILTKWPLSNCNTLYRLKCSKLMRHLFSGKNLAKKMFLFLFLF